MADIREGTSIGERRRAREYAMQLLFQLDLSPGEIEEAIESFWKGKKVRASIVEFAGRLVRGAVESRDRIDSLLSGISHHWRIERMAVVDRNLLRLALYELIFEEDTPRVVVINEAIEIAKKFGNDESGPFVNGILDAVRIRLESGEINLSQPPLASQRIRTPA